MKETKDKGYPKKKAVDAAHALVKGTISSVPYVGGLASEIFSLVIAPSIEKRRDDWFRSIGERLSELEGKAEGFSVENLKANESFTTTFTNATILALRTHQEEKLETLRNAIINAALPGSPEDDIQILFLHFVDAFTKYHIKILDFLKDPNKWSEREKAGLPKFSDGQYGFIKPIRIMILMAFPELKESEGFLDQLIYDLDSRGLIDTKSRVKDEIVEITKSNLTDLGKDFVSFISEPQELTP